MAENEGDSGGQVDRKIIVDEDWKTAAQAEKEALQKELEAMQAEAKNEAAEGRPSNSRSAALPPASFATLVSSLVTQAAIALQGLQVEGSPALPPDLPMAKHVIDLLEVLEEKTQGNLTEQERSLLSQALSELRLVYVETVSQLNKAATSPPPDSE